MTSVARRATAPAFVAPRRWASVSSYLPTKRAFDVLFCLAILPVVAVVIRYFSRRLRRIARDVQTRTGSMTHVLEEMIGGHRIVRVFGGEAYERMRAVKAANALRTSMTPAGRK